MKFLATKNLDWEAQQATHTVSGSQETEGQREGTAHSRGEADGQGEETVTLTINI